MEIVNYILTGFDVAVTPINLLYCFIGVFLGTLVGVLPGLGPVASISMLLPVVYGIGNPTTSIIFLAGIYYGTQYGGSTTSILLKLPGEISSVVTAIDGYQLTQQGRGGSALSIAALSSFLAGTIATLIIAVLAVPMSEIAFLFGPVEYVGLFLLGLIASVTLVNGSLLNGLAMIVLGMLLGIIGADINSGIERFAFNIPELSDGISFGVLVMGVIGLSELIYNYFHSSKNQNLPSIGSLYPTKEELKQATPPALRGTLLGSLLGLLPGGGTIISSFASYILEKKLSKTPEKFGKGAIAGVAGPEAANNAGAQTGFIPMLCIGIPTTPVMALMLSTLIIYNVAPGPQFVSQQSTIFWGLVVSMWIGNLFLVILNLPLIRLWILLLKIPQRILYLIIFSVCIVGAYYINNNWFEVLLLIPMIMLGYVFKLLNCEPTPLILGFVVGPLLEDHLRKVLLIFHGDLWVFVDRPIALTFIIISCILLLFSITKQLKFEPR